MAASRFGHGLFPFFYKRYLLQKGSVWLGQDKSPAIWYEDRLILMRALYSPLISFRWHFITLHLRFTSCLHSLPRVSRGPLVFPSCPNRSALLSSLGFHRYLPITTTQRKTISPFSGASADQFADMDMVPDSRMLSPLWLFLEGVGHGTIESTLHSSKT